MFQVSEVIGCKRPLQKKGSEFSCYIPLGGGVGNSRMVLWSVCAAGKTKRLDSIVTTSDAVSFMTAGPVAVATICVCVQLDIWHVEGLSCWC